MNAAARATLRAAGDAGFLDQLRRLAAAAGPAPWPHADDPLLIGLERWGRALAEVDIAAGVLALTAAGRHGLPQAIAAGGDELEGMGFSSSEEVDDGGPVETQLEVAHAQARADQPDEDALNQVFDPSRQLHVWSDDLRPDDDRAFLWYWEVGQCALIALRGLDDGYDPDPDRWSYYWWPPAVTVGRGLVAAARGLRQPKVELAGVITALGVAIAAEADG